MVVVRFGLPSAYNSLSISVINQTFLWGHIHTQQFYLVINEIFKS